jgi:Alr-MurF fusion protein
MLTFQQLIPITGAPYCNWHRTAPVVHLLTDSRKLSQPAGTLFFAIRGRHNDGHLYLEQLYKLGVRQFVVEDAAEASAAYTQRQISCRYPAAWRRCRQWPPGTGRSSRFRC